MKRKGFTLIELLIVVTIIGILAVALVPRIIGGSSAARDARRQTDVQTVATGLEYFLSENGTFDDLGPGSLSGGDTLCSSDSGVSSLGADLINYVGALPPDPSGDDITNEAFGESCDGGYVVLVLTDDGGNLTEYAIAALLETPEVGDDYVYDGVDAMSEATYAGIVSALDGAVYAADDGWFIVY